MISLLEESQFRIFQNLTRLTCFATLFSVVKNALPRLTSLCLFGDRVDKEDLDLILKIKSLKRLQMFCNRKVKANVYFELPNLEELFSESEFEVHAGMVLPTRLKKLEVEKINYKDENAVVSHNIRYLHVHKESNIDCFLKENNTIR